MATGLYIAESGADASLHRVTQRADNVGLPDLHFFRFGLRQLFWLVTVASALLTVASVASAATTFMVYLGATIMAAHVCSTTLGRRLRAHADAVRHTAELEPNDDFRAESDANRVSGDAVFPPRPISTSALHGRSRSSNWLFTITVVGIVLGGGVGSALLVATIGHRTSPAGIAVGAISLAVVGGWCMFLIANFYGIAREVVKEALAAQNKDEIRPAAR